VELVAALLLLEILASGQSRLQGADDAKKAPDALQTARAFLNFALTGQTKAAANLGEPGKSYDREEKIKEFERLDPKKPLAIVRFEADDEYALAITESVKEVRRKGKTREGPLSIRLVKKDGRWLIRDIDMGSKSAAMNLERFRREHPKAKVVIPKKDK
jgi:hypothetical protein